MLIKCLWNWLLIWAKSTFPTWKRKCINCTANLLNMMLDLLKSSFGLMLRCNLQIPSSLRWLAKFCTDCVKKHVGKVQSGKVAIVSWPFNFSQKGSILLTFICILPNWFTFMFWCTRQGVKVFINCCCVYLLLKLNSTFYPKHCVPMDLCFTPKGWSNYYRNGKSQWLMLLSMLFKCICMYCINEEISCHFQQIFES